MFGKGERGGYQNQHNNDLRKVSKRFPTTRPVISFWLSVVDAKVLLPRSRVGR